MRQDEFFQRSITYTMKDFMIGIISRNRLSGVVWVISVSTYSPLLIFLHSEEIPTRIILLFSHLIPAHLKCVDCMPAW